ncbi:MAG: ion transporter [Nocardia sp.]|nr:ion transporter [Nocardia sp.]
MEGTVVSQYVEGQPPLPEEYPRKPPALWTDLLMLGLAVVSVAMVCWITFFTVPDNLHHTFVIVDYSICAVFFLEFMYRWRRADWGWTFPFVYWYEVLGMIPISSPVFRAFRLLRIVVIVVRLTRVIDRAFGDRVTAMVINRSLGVVVDAVKKPVAEAVLVEVADVLRRGQYTSNIASALEENRAELDAMILELIKQDPAVGRVRYVPFHDEIIHGIANTVFRIVFQVLADPRTDELVGDVLRENINQMKVAVRAGGHVPEAVDNKIRPASTAAGEPVTPAAAAANGQRRFR